MSSTLVTFFQPPPSAGFKIAGNSMYSATASQSSGKTRLRSDFFLSIAAM